MLATTIIGFSILGFIILLAVWIVLAMLPAAIAKSKGHSFIAWFILSIFFWWITLFVTLFLHDRNQPT
ncbi:MAG TPA: hypothetical protein VGM08_03630 [Candidatus Saccharimonadales bacterium]